MIGINSIATAAAVAVWLSVAWLGLVGVVMIVAPNTALRALARFGSTVFINVAEHVLRFVAGAALFIISPETRAPLPLSIAGAFIALSSVAILLVPRRWHHAYALFWARTLPPWFVRLLGPPSLAAAVGLGYMIT